MFGVADTMKGQIPRGLVVLRADAPIDEASQARLSADLVQMVREQIGGAAGMRQVDVVAALPRTRSGKILRKLMADIAGGVDPVVPGTIEDASVLDALRPVLHPEPRTPRYQPAAGPPIHR